MTETIIEDLGEFIRENVEAWASRHKDFYEEDIEDVVGEEDAETEDEE